MKLKYALFDLNGSIIFTIFDQDISYIFTDDSDVNSWEFKCKNDWIVCSIDSPELDIEDKIIYLRGKLEDEDRKIVVVKTENLANTKLEIMEALEYWAENCDWYGPKEKSNNNIRYEVPIITL